MGPVTAGALMGIGGTLAMDAWALVLERVAGQARPDWAKVGRWVAHLPRGQVFHDDIGAVPPVAAERGLGWAFHYAVGIVYGVVFALLAGSEWLAAPSFLPVWLFSLLTITAGWFLLQPGMGLGWAAAKTPKPGQVRAMGLVAHTVFAAGMWGVAVAI